MTLPPSPYCSLPSPQPLSYGIDLVGESENYWIRISNFSLELFNAPIIEVTPMASVVVEAKRSAGLLGSGSGTLNLGDLDRSSSLSSLSVGDSFLLMRDALLICFL